MAVPKAPVVTDDAAAIWFEPPPPATVPAAVLAADIPPKKEVNIPLLLFMDELTDDPADVDVVVVSNRLNPPPAAAELFVPLKFALAAS